MLVVEVDEVLEGVDVAQGDRPLGIEPRPVVERVAVVAQDRRTVEQAARFAERFT
jgi:hypothetical protein